MSSLSGRSDVQSSSRGPRRGQLLAGQLGFAVIAASAFIPLELALEAWDGRWEAARLGVAVAATQLVAMLPATVLCGVLLLRNAWRAAVVVGVTSAIAVMAWAGLDHFARTITGNRAVHYLEYLAEPNVWHWAGGTDRLVELALARGGGVLACAVGALIAATVAARVLSRRAVGRRAVPVVLLWAALLGVGLVDDGASPGLGATAPPATLLERRADEIYGRYFSQLAALPVLGEAPIEGADPPSVVVIVCDGLRADALTPEIMPRLWRWSQRGTRFAFHHATANRSDWGMFGLVYGLPPLHYASTVRGHVGPTLPVLFRRNGYATHYLTSAGDQRWLLVGRFLRQPYFDDVFEPTGGAEDWERDRAVIAHAAQTLDRAGGPRLLLLWLVATHYPYSAPPAYDGLDWPPREEAIAVEHRDLHRAARPVYLRSTRFLDDELASWLERVDLTRTIVVVTADHGESLYEDGTFAHGSRLSSVQTRVPFIIAGGSVPSDRVVDRPTSHLDVVPSLLALAGAPRQTLAWLPGYDLIDPADRPPTYAVAYQPTRAHRTLQDVLGGGQGDEPRELVFMSDQLRVALRLDPTVARATGVMRVDEAGLPSAVPLDTAEMDSAMAWLDDHLARTARAVPAP